MVSKNATIVILVWVLIVPSVFAQDRRNSPLKNETPNTRRIKNSLQDRSSVWSKFAEELDKIKSRNPRLHRKYSDLIKWHNDLKRVEHGSTKEEYKEGGAPKTQKTPISTENTDENPEAEKDQEVEIETIKIEENDSFAKKAFDNSGKDNSKDNSMIVYSSEGAKRIKPREPFKQELDDGLIVIGR